MPREYFNGSGRRKFDDPTYPDDPAEQFQRILSMGATPNGIYGLKVFPDQHDVIAKTCAWTKLLPDLKFIYLERQDTLGQAMSWARVAQTGKYRSVVQSDVRENYNAALIRKFLYMVIKGRARWSLFFARTSIEPLRLFYEEIETNPQQEIDRIAAFVGGVGPAIIKQEMIEVKVQRDTTIDQWRARFRAEHGNPDAIDPA